MTLAQFFGCGLIAFGPPLAMFLLTIANDPIKVIMLVASSFFWLVSLLLSSVLYKVVSPLQPYLAFGALFSVVFQELFRFLLFLLIVKAEAGLKKVTGEHNASLIENKHILAYVSGLGFGLISGAFSLVNVLADMVGPGTVGLYGDDPRFFAMSSLLALASMLLQVTWSVAAFHGMHARRVWPCVCVWLSHLAATGVTLLNPRYGVAVPLVFLILLASSILALYVAGASPASLRAALKGAPVISSGAPVSSDTTGAPSGAPVQSTVPENMPTHT